MKSQSSQVEHRVYVVGLKGSVSLKASNCRSGARKHMHILCFFAVLVKGII